MTTSLETLCRQVEQESAAATEGPWEWKPARTLQYLYGGNGNSVSQISMPMSRRAQEFFHRYKSDARFIATARDFAPKAATALRGLDALINRQPHHPSCHIHGKSGHARMQCNCWKYEVASLLAQFEQPKENA